MMKKKLLRICAAILALAMCTGVISGVAVMKSNKSTEVNGSQINAAQKTETEEISSFEQSRAENLKFKIGELWRLSLNTDLDTSIKNAVQIINQNYDSEELADAVKRTEEDFDIVADEYLASIQMGLNFELYMSDRDGYLAEKEETEYTGEILTVDMIDEYLNDLNTKEAEKIVNSANENRQSSAPKVEMPNVQPNVPNAESILPQNPANEIRKEIDGITQSVFD